MLLKVTGVKVTDVILLKVTGVILLKVANCMV